jgi:L-lysine exporter family protein LysE/ArgO
VKQNEPSPQNQKKFLGTRKEKKMEAWLHGILLAFGLILPLGVQNVFIFHQGAMQPRWIRALPAVITAAVCDTLLILLAVLGLSFVILNFHWLQTILFGVGFLFLLYMGWSIWHSSSSTVEHQAKVLTVKQQILFASSVSLLNPHALLDIFGVIGTSSMIYSGQDKVWFTFSCLIVSWVWFIALSLCGRMLGNFDPSGRMLKRFNQLSALIIWGAAAYIGRQLLRL